MPDKYALNFFVSYLLVNVMFFILLQLQLNNQNCFICLTEHIFDLLPSINRPYKHLLQDGNTDRAALVRSFYSFNWLTFVVFLVAAFIGRCARLSNEAVFKYVRDHETFKNGPAKKGKRYT